MPFGFPSVHKIKWIAVTLWIWLPLPLISCARGYRLNIRPSEKQLNEFCASNVTISSAASSFPREGKHTLDG